MTIEKERKQNQIKQADKIAELLSECTALAFRLNLKIGDVVAEYAGYVHWFEIRIDEPRRVRTQVGLGSTNSVKQMQSMKKWLEKCLEVGAIAKIPPSINDR